MSQFTKHRKKRIGKLKDVAHILLKSGNAYSFIIKNKDFIPTVVPDDFITLLDAMVQEGHKPEDLKVMTNKILNIFYEPIARYQRVDPDPNSFLGVLEHNNPEMELLLLKIRPIFKAFVLDF